MKKNGFVATSILYTFFLVFLTFLTFFITNFLQNRVLVKKINDNAKEFLSSMSNKDFLELDVADYVIFEQYDNYCNENENDKCNVFKNIDEIKFYLFHHNNELTKKVYFFISDSFEFPINDYDKINNIVKTYNQNYIKNSFKISENILSNYEVDLMSLDDFKYIINSNYGSSLINQNIIFNHAKDTIVKATSSNVDFQSGNYYKVGYFNNNGSIIENSSKEYSYCNELECVYVNKEILDSTQNTSYKMRLVLKMEVDSTSAPYIKYGSGTSTNPYVIENGGRK